MTNVDFEAHVTPRQDLHPDELAAVLKDAKNTILHLIQNQKNPIFPASEIEAAWVVRQRVSDALQKLRHK